MKRRTMIIFTAVMLVLLCACRAAKPEDAAVTTVPSETVSAETLTPAPSETPEPTDPPTGIPDQVPLPELDEPVDGWAEAYLAFLDDNYDILAALWPDGMTGVGFIDLDLDGTPELVLFDQGASATLGAQLFDLIDGQVYCVSSVLDSAKGAFDDAYFSPVSVCTSYFEAFRLSSTEDGYVFWVSSSNGTMESSWDELVTFACEDGVLVPESVCSGLLEIDPETGVVVTESYAVGGESADAEAYQAAVSAYTDAADTGYEGKGVFLWNDMQRYDTTYDGFMAMAEDAVSAYVPISG